MQSLLFNIESEIKKRSISEEEISKIISSVPPLLNRRIIMGYASVSIIDRENQKIPVPALKEAVRRFMEEERYRVLCIFHSDAVIGRVLPKWTDPKTGRTYKTEVDNIGWRIIGEIRSDIELANKVWEEILKGNLRSFSVAGTSHKKHEAIQNGFKYTEIDELSFLEVTICSTPVNPMSTFSVLWEGENRVEI